MLNELGNHLWFDEIRDLNGDIRSHYQKVYESWESTSEDEKRKLRTRSIRLFSGDGEIDILPRIITRKELEFLRHGVEQRAMAIRKFLIDYYGGKTGWARVIPPSLIESVIKRNHEESVRFQLAPDSIAFPYGPDIMRDRFGRWRVIEDSAGCVGGIGDIMENRNIMNRLMPKYRHVLKASENPMDFYDKLTGHFKRQAKAKGGIALAMFPKTGDGDDHECFRFGKILELAGIEVCYLGDRNRHVTVEDNNVYFKTAKKKIRVGYLICYAGPEQLDSRVILTGLRILRSKYRTHRTYNRSRAIKDMIRTIGGRSFQSASLRGLVGTNFSPGVQFINDKMFGIYVDRLIEFYLKEDPILSSIPARAIVRLNARDQLRLDRKALYELALHRDRYVIKRVDEDGGEGVWIGHRLSKIEFSTLIERMEQEPENFIFQEFEHLSVLENRIVDLRLHAHVDCKKIIVSNVPWGRANWVHGDGKVNLRGNGFTSPVLAMKRR